MVTLNLIYNELTPSGDRVEETLDVFSAELNDAGNVLIVGMQSESWENKLKHIPVSRLYEWDMYERL